MSEQQDHEKTDYEVNIETEDEEIIVESSDKEDEEPVNSAKMEETIVEEGDRKEFKLKKVKFSVSKKGAPLKRRKKSRRMDVPEADYDLNSEELETSDFEKMNYSSTQTKGAKTRNRESIDNDVDREMDEKGFRKVNVDVTGTKVSSAPDERYWPIECFCLRWFFCWVNPYLIRGFFSSPTMQDLPSVSDHCKCKAVEKKFDRIFPKLRKCCCCGLLLTMIYCFGMEFGLAGMIQLASTLSQVFIPKIMERFLKLLSLPLESESQDDIDKMKILRELLPTNHPIYPSDNVEYTRRNNWEIWIYLGLLLFIYFLNVWGMNYSIHISTRVGMKIRTLLVSKMYQKSLKLSNKSRGKYESGMVLNMISNDATKIENFHQLAHLGWTGGIMIVGQIYFLIELLGWGAATGLSTNLVIIPFGVFGLIILLSLRRIRVKVLDKRLSKINEVFQSIKIVKYFSWEGSFYKRIWIQRSYEIVLIRGIYFVFSFLYALIVSLSQFSSLVAFVTFFLVNGYLDPITVFTSLTYFIMMRVPLTYAILVLVGLSEVLDGYKRIEKFLVAEEFEKIERSDGREELSILIEDGDFQWERKREENEQNNNIDSRTFNTKKKKKKKNIMDRILLCKKSRKKNGNYDVKFGFLKGIDLEVKKNDLVMVIGEVGSGKSSLIYSILGEMKLLSGRVKVNGSISFTSQLSWIHQSSLYDNVLFGEEEDEERWEEIVKCCQLERDLEEIGGRDFEIGERGATLSGGQKYRVQLARACYKKSELVLLDDPLAAVDSHVGKSLFFGCIKEYLKDRTRIVVTHQMDYLKHSNWVVLMEKGRIVEQGKFQELMEDENGKVHKFVSKSVEKSKIRDETVVDLPENISCLEEEEEEGGEEEICEVHTESNHNSEEENEQNDGDGNQEEVIVIDEEIDEEIDETKESSRRRYPNNLYRQTKIIEDEEIKKGVTSLRSVCSYISFMCPLNIYPGCGCCLTISVIIFVGFLTVIVQSSLDLWITEWTNGKFSEQFSQDYHMGVYVSEIGNDGKPVMSYFDIFDSNHAYVVPPYYNSSVSEDPNLPPPITNDGYVNCSRYNSGMGEIKASTLYTCPSIIMGACGCDDYFVDVKWKQGYNNGTKIKTGLTQIENVLVYASLSVLFMIGMFIRNSVLSIFAVTASQVLHNKSLKRVLKAPMIFFETNPLGRIVSRFSHDVSQADGPIITSVIISLGFIFALLGFGFIVIYNTNGMGMFFLLPLTIIYSFLYLLFRRNNVDLNRLESVSKTPILGQISESFSGIHTIRVYKSESRFVKRLQKMIDSNNRAFWLMKSTQRWLGFTVGVVGMIFVMFICTFFILAYYYVDIFSFEIEYTALALSYSIILTQLFFKIVEEICKIDGMFNSIERLEYYVKNTPIEEPFKKENKNKEIEKGMISFDRYSMRYRPGLELALNDISFDIKPNERIGVVGRTGSGKSSLIVALLRIVEPTEGTIFIDGHDITQLNLLKLRTTISTIPQSSSLFNGTIRSNLDPFHQYKDGELWTVLKRTYMNKKVKAMKGQLDAEMKERGSNFSVGERQLLCIARALLRDSKVLILDEATSSVDVATDRKIQKTVRTSFKKCTSLIIAHRLITVIDSDRILVMDHGRVGEFDTPKNLLKDKKYSLFRDLVRETGKSTEKMLYDIAFGNMTLSYLENVVE